MSFEINVVTPFSGVTLEIGGAVETYWKAIASPVSAPATKLKTPRFIPPPRSFTSAQTSPSVHSITTAGSHSLTHSSLSGNFFYITVQVTRDRQPVIFSEWQLPEDGYDVGVSDVTLEQFQALAERRGRHILPSGSSSLSAKEIQGVISQSMVALSDLLKVSRASQMAPCGAKRCGVLDYTRQPRGVCGTGVPDLFHFGTKVFWTSG